MPFSRKTEHTVSKAKSGLLLVPLQCPNITFLCNLLRTKSTIALPQSSFDK